MTFYQIKCGFMTIAMDFNMIWYFICSVLC